MPGLRLCAGARRDGGRKAQARRRDRDRENQPRPVRHRACWDAVALWRAAQSVPSRPYPGRLELGFRGCGGGRPRAARARDRHGRLGPRSRRLQQYRRSETERRARLELRHCAGVPLARLRLCVCTHDRRRLRGAPRDRRSGSARPLFTRASARADRRARTGNENRRTAARHPHFLWRPRGCDRLRGRARALRQTRARGHGDRHRTVL